MATRRLSKVMRTHRALEAGAALEASPQIGRFALEFGVFDGTSICNKERIPAPP
jgi:hypothetical protein